MMGTTKPKSSATKREGNVVCFNFAAKTVPTSDVWGGNSADTSSRQEFDPPSNFADDLADWGTSPHMFPSGGTSQDLFPDFLDDTGIPHQNDGNQGTSSDLDNPFGLRAAWFEDEDGPDFF